MKVCLVLSLIYSRFCCYYMSILLWEISVFIHPKGVHRVAGMRTLGSPFFLVGGNNRREMEWWNTAMEISVGDSILSMHKTILLTYDTYQYIRKICIYTDGPNLRWFNLWFSSLEWFESHMNLVETTLWILNFDFFPG